jgi:hypothetical protein
MPKRTNGKAKDVPVRDVPVNKDGSLRALNKDGTPRKKMEMSNPRYKPGTRAMRGLGNFIYDLTDEVTEKICEHLKTGAYPAQAAIAAGVPGNVWESWVSKAEHLLENGVPPHESIYVRMLYACEQSYAEAEIDLLQKIDDQDEKYWQRWAWTLERTRSARYAQVSKLDVKSQSVTAVLSIPKDAPTDHSEWLDRVKERKQVQDAEYKEIPEGSDGDGKQA